MLSDSSKHTLYYVMKFHPEHIWRELFRNSANRN